MTSEITTAARRITRHYNNELYRGWYAHYDKDGYCLGVWSTKMTWRQAQENMDWANYEYTAKDAAAYNEGWDHLEAYLDAKYGPYGALPYQKGAAYEWPDRRRGS
ncbi:MAG: hypothetical protein Q3979_05540 [Actinomycetaceae bacterium]|nr:hypothetical protein [Actinomycetaceae bacterium]